MIINQLEFSMFIVLYTIFIFASFIFIMNRVIKNSFKSPDNKHLINNIIQPIIFTIDEFIKNKNNEK